MLKQGLRLLGLAALCLMLVSGSVLGQGPTPDRPLCADLTGASSPLVRYDIPFSTVSSGGVYCRILVESGRFLVNPAQIGNQTLIDQGIIHAVDVFAIALNGSNITSFNNPINICIQGSGRLFFLDANQTPRPLQELFVITDGGYSCGTISSAGTIALTSGASQAPAPQSTAAAGTPAATLAPGVTPTAVPVASSALTNCQVTTRRIVRLRSQASTSSTILTRLPFNTTWTATEKTTGWYRIIWRNTQGWVSADFVTTSGNC